MLRAFEFTSGNKKCRKKGKEGREVWRRRERVWSENREMEGKRKGRGGGRIGWERKETQQAYMAG